MKKKRGNCNIKYTTFSKNLEIYVICLKIAPKEYMKYIQIPIN